MAPIRHIVEISCIMQYYGAPSTTFEINLKVHFKLILSGRTVVNLKVNYRNQMHLDSRCICTLDGSPSIPRNVRYRTRYVRIYDSARARNNFHPAVSHSPFAFHRDALHLTRLSPMKNTRKQWGAVPKRSRRFITASVRNRRAETSKISSVLSTFTARLRQVRGPTVAEKRSSNNKTRGRTDGRTDNRIASTRSRYAAPHAQLNIKRARDF